MTFEVIFQDGSHGRCESGGRRLGSAVSVVEGIYY